MIIDNRLVLAVPLVLVGWIAVLALVMRLSGAAPSAMVILPPADMLNALPAQISILGISRYSVFLKGGEGLVAALYKAGAPLVLPAGLSGCLPEGGNSTSDYKAKAAWDMARPK